MRRSINLVGILIAICIMFVPGDVLSNNVEDSILWLDKSYEIAGPFSEGIALVKGGPYNYYYGFINTRGEEVVPAKYDYARSFSEGRALVEKDRKYGFIDETGKEVIPLQYTNAFDFNDGLAPFSIGEREKTGWVGRNLRDGYIDRDGKIVIEPKYTASYFFSEGLAFVSTSQVNPGKLYGYINTKGEKIVKEKYIKAEPFQNGFALVATGYDPNYKYGFIDKTGREITNMKYDFAWDFSDGLAWVSIGDKYGYIDGSGKEVIPLKYSSARDFSEGYAFVSTEKYGKGGYIDKSQNFITPIKYDLGFPFSDGMARVTIGENTGYIDRNGNEIIPIIDRGMFVYSPDFSDGFLSLRTADGKYGLVDTQGNEVLPSKYDVITSFSEGYAFVKLNGKMGILRNPKLVEIERQKNEPSTWAKDEVEDAISLELVTEDIKGDYRSNINRLEFSELIVKMVEKAIDKPLEYNENVAFNDTKATEVLKAHEAGIINGISKEEFAPEVQISREQLATMIHRAINHIESENSNEYLNEDYYIDKYADSSKISSWAKQSVGILTSNNIIKGVSDNEFGYSSSVTREQAIILILRAYNLTSN